MSAPLALMRDAAALADAIKALRLQMIQQGHTTLERTLDELLDLADTVVDRAEDAAADLLLDQGGGA
jgi:hypothetical protein